LDPKRVVLLVDNKQRDLLADALIAHHLRGKDVECVLEPLEAYQGVLGAYRPHMIIFNHLTAGHLARYSRRLAEMGVLTAVLTNEGITYDRELLKFIVGNHHRDAHIDYFLCWNGELKSAMEEIGTFPQAKKVVVGIPRFDLYCPPWPGLGEVPQPATGRKRVLVCTNFYWADFRGTTAPEVFLAVLKDRIPTFQDGEAILELQYQSRFRVFAFLDELAKARKWDIVVRPHPYEKLDPYRQWWDGLPAERQARVRLDKDSTITSLILGSDLLISCETCTTALEAWIARKPSLELTFERHPIFFHEEHARHQPLCDRAADLPGMVEAALADPTQSTYAAGRATHLRTWCHTTDGNACLLTAEAIADALRNHPSPDWSKLHFSDARRQAKLALTRGLGEAYHYDPLLRLKYRLNPKKYATKHFAYEKSIRPADVAEVHRRITTELANLERTP
jgi:surface carbohydrate biosynthesis protein